MIENKSGSRAEVDQLGAIKQLAPWGSSTMIAHIIKLVEDSQADEVTVVADSLPSDGGFRVSQLNLNDNSVEGLRHESLPIETVQYHPEGAPGPLDALAVFDRFLAAAGAGRGR